MKNVISIFLFLCSFCSFAQTNKTIELHFDISDFVVKPSEKANDILVSSKADYLYIYKSDTLLPALPFRIVNVLIKDNQEYIELKTHRKDKLLCHNISLSANLNDHPVREYGKKTSKIAADSQTEYPIESVEFTGTHLMDGYKYLSFIVSPFKYDSRTKNLYYSSDITFTISLKSDQKHLNSSQKKIRGSNMSDYINKNVYNGNELLSLYPNSGIKVNNLYDESYKLIIVTADSLKPSFQKLANWKTIKGIRTKILTVEEIDTTYIGQSLSMKIKEALYDYYDGNFQGLKYAILGGDVNIVPSQMVPVTSGVSPSDLFFSCFDNMNWNNNGNGVVGEITDYIDLDPEIFVSRIPVSCIMDVRNYVQRIIDYELSPNLENWENKIFMCGAHIYNLYQDSIGNTISDAQKESDELYDSIIAPKWNCSRTRLFDTDTDFEGGSHYTFNREHVQLELSKGYTIINVATHGNPDCYQMEWFENENYLVDDALSLVNSGSSVIVALSCLTNAFDSLETCLSEAFIRNPNSGILAYFGASRENYYSVCFKYNLMFYKNLFENPSHIFGEVAQAARSAFIAYCNNPYSYRSVCLSLNPIGDPTFSVFLSKPKMFSNIEFANEEGNLQLITNVDSCNICITSLEDNGVGLYQFYDNISHIDLSQIQCASRICITKTGYVPYVIYYGVDYIQNEIIQNENRDYYTNNLKIGKNITNLKPIGNVLIKNSSLIIESNSFELHEGTTIIDSDIIVK